MTDKIYISSEKYFAKSYGFDCRYECPLKREGDQTNGKTG